MTQRQQNTRWETVSGHQTSACFDGGVNTDDDVSNEEHKTRENNNKQPEYRAGG